MATNEELKSRYGSFNDSTKYTLKGGDKDYILDFSGGIGQGYRSDNWFRTGTKKHVAAAVKYYLDYGVAPTLQKMKDMGYSIDKSSYDNIMYDLNEFRSRNGLDDTTYSARLTDDSVPTDPKNAAFNAYYRDLYSLQKGTQGKAILDNLEDSYARQASSAAVLADANYQQAALQQAQTVKAITDQVRAERMARLKAGMSEAQIANQDMQLMMTNVNALNQQNQALNQARLEAQLGMNMAKDQAYADYLAQANARGQVATGMYAADSGNLNYAVDNYLQKVYGSTNVPKTKRDQATLLQSGQPRQ